MKRIALFLFALCLTGSASAQGLFIGQFYTNPDTGCVGQVITFVDTSIGATAPGYWVWNFGDGSQTQFISSKTTTHTYSQTGVYNVYFCVYDSIRNDTACTTQQVHVVNCGSTGPLQATIGGVPDSICFINRALSPWDSTSGGSGVYNYFWDFGDGTTSAMNRPTHVYASAGTYTVTLRVIDPVNGDTVFATKTVVASLLKCNFSPLNTQLFYFPQPPCANQPVFFGDSTFGGSFRYSYTWDFGDGTTSTMSNPSHTYSTPGTYTVQLCVSDSITMSTVCDSQVVTVNLRCGPVVTGGFFISQDSVCPGQSILFADSVTGGSGPIIRQWDFGDGTTFTGTNPTHSYTGTGTYSVELCLYDTLVGDSVCISQNVYVLSTCGDTLSGLVYLDANQNNTFDAGEVTFGNVPLNIFPGPVTIFTDVNGEYEEPVAPGTYVVTAPSLLNFSNTSPSNGQYIHTAIGGNMRFSGDFGYDTLRAKHNLRVVLFRGAHRPGRNAFVYVSIRNLGPQAVSGSFTLDYSNSSPAVYVGNRGGTNNATNQSVTWTFTNLQPFQYYRTPSNWMARAEFSIPTSTLINTPINYSAVVNPFVGDLDTTNNRDSLIALVSNSYDPNDKRAFPGEGPDGLIEPGQRLTYMIRFQNTGNDTAFLVVVRDTLPAELDLSTFDMVDATHPYSVRVGADREAVFRFENILLPDSTTDEANSQGFLSYSIDHVANLPRGSQILNRAGIFFDFNAPIITPTATSTLRLLSSINNPGTFTNLKVYPNPASERVWVKFENDDQQSHKLIVTDAQGKMIDQYLSNQSEIEIDLTEQPAGLYFFQLQSENGQHASGKILKK
ncbi:MAG: PKD domain-containing protein [Bacteroidota bacterium]